MFPKKQKKNGTFRDISVIVYKIIDLISVADQINLFPPVSGYSTENLEGFAFAVLLDNTFQSLTFHNIAWMSQEEQSISGTSRGLCVYVGVSFGVAD